MALVTSTSSLGGLAGSNALARLLVVISGDSSSLERSLSRASGSVQAFGTNAAALSNSLIRGVTLPILGLGGASLAVASQFESAMGRVAGLTPILDTTGKSITQISDELLELAQTVPTGPVELANALYFAGSAGLDAATAMEVVELSAKGAAIGMGEAADISKVLIFALNNYQSAGLTAEKAMDSLTVAIKEGTAEPNELAIALGRLLPVAKEAGVTFEEVVGSVAQLTNVGFPARVATTSLRALFAELLAPTEQATDRLKQLGITSQELRDTLMYGGPIAAFEAIQKAVKGDEDALRDILPQIRGFAGYLALTRDEGERARDIFEKTATAVGDLDKAFNIISKTPAFQFQIALNKMKVAGIEIGRKLIPIFIKFSHILGDVADSIAGLPEWVKQLVVDFGLLAAAVGPALKLLTNMGAFTGGLITGFKQFSTTITAVGIASIAAYAGFSSLARGGASLFTVVTTLTTATIALFGALRLLQFAALKGALGAGMLSEAIIGLSAGKLGLIAAGIAAIGVAVAYFVGEANKARQSAQGLVDHFSAAAKSGERFGDAINNLEVAPRIGEIIRDIAHVRDLLDKPTGVALPKTIEGLGEQMVHVAPTITHFVDLLAEQGALTSEQVIEWSRYANALNVVSRTGGSLRGTFRGLGLQFDDFTSFLNNLKDVTGGVSDEVIDLGNSFNPAVDNLLNLTSAYGTMIRVNRDVQNDMLANIALTQGETKAREKWANQLGISTDYLGERLDSMGVTALGAGQDVKNAFELALTGMGEVTPAMAEMEAMVAETVGNINSTMEGFMSFEKVKTNVKKSTDKLLEIFQANSQAMLNEVSNIQELAARGVPGDVLGYLAEQGPGFVQKFADASDAELRRLVTIYQVQLGAMDDAILQESLHQERKGQNMVQRFTTGILSSSHLPPQIARQIVQDMTQAFASGKITEAGLKLALDFTNGVGHVKNLTREEARQAIQWFVEEIEKRNLTEVGRRQARELAKGLSSEVGISRKAARELVSSVVEEAKNKSQQITGPAAKLQAFEYAEGLQSGKDRVTTAGQRTAASAKQGMRTGSQGTDSIGASATSQYAAGIRGGAQEAYNAAYYVAHQAKLGFDEGSQGSPRYFTYYLAQDIMKDFTEGLKNGRLSKFVPPDIMFPVSGEQGRLRDGGKPRENNVDLTLDVTIDRSKTARALDWEYDVRGT